METLGSIFLPTSRQASCNYGIGVDGRVGMYVEEKNRSWCSSSSANDQRAVTIECASDSTEPYAFKDVVYQKLITLCVDICKRNGKSKLLWLGDKDKTLSYEPKSDEMVLTVHRWFANKSCPGSWMYARMGDLAEKVTAQLGGSSSDSGTSTTQLYRVRKTWSDSKSQKGAYKILSNAKKCADANPGYTAVPIGSKRKRRVAGYARVSTDHEDQVTSSRYEAVKAQFDEVTQAVADKADRKKLLEQFLHTVEGQAPVTEFDERLWSSLVDFVTVYSEKGIRVTFKDGTEIQV